MSQRRWSKLRKQVIACEKCPRLVEHCREVAKVKRRAYLDCDYWGKPVPNFGSQGSSLLVVGLAPGAHGANRTGRMFTGDRSGEWLYRALHVAGFASQAEATDLNDGLELIDCAITNICRCAPPGNKPEKEELARCQPFLEETFELCQPIVILALGSLAWNATMLMAKEMGWFEIPRPRPKFGHGATVELQPQRWLIASYHPSQQNTFTGKLTRRMLNSVMRKARNRIEETKRDRSLE